MKTDIQQVPMHLANSYMRPVQNDLLLREAWAIWVTKQERWWLHACMVITGHGHDGHGPW